MRAGGEAAIVRCHGRVVERSSLAACSLTGQRAAGSTGGGGGRSAAGVRAGEHSWPGSERGVQRRSERACVHAQVPACAERQGERGRERGERKREWREKRKVNGLIQFKLKIFN